MNRIGKKSKILKLIAISIVFIGIGFSSDFSFKKAELFIDGNTYVINILASKDLKGDKTQELICKLNTGEYGIGFVETGSSKLSLFIPIVIKDKKITDMAAGDIFNDRSNAIAAVADKKVYLFKLTKDNIVEEAGTIDLYKKGEYGRDKEDAEKYKKVASEDTIEGKSIAIGDADGDGKQEIVITKTDSWIYGNYPTYIVQVFKWDPKGNEFKTISLSDDNGGVGDENITIDEINNYSVFLVGNKLRQIKLGNFGFVHNGISAIGKIGSSKVVAFCGIESVRKDGKVIGVTQVHFQRQFRDDLTPDNFKNLRTLQIRDFKKKGSYPPEFVSSAVDDYQSLVFADFDNDGKNELIINCKDSFAVIKEGRFLEVKAYVNPLEALKIVAKERFQKWEDKAGKMIQKEDFDTDHLKKITDAEEPEKLKWTNEEKEFKLGDLAYLQKKNDEAITHYKECIKEVKDNSWVKYGSLRLADLYYKLNNKTESENTLNNFIKNYPDFENIGRAYLQLGFICQEQKRYKEAKEFYAKVKEAMKPKERPKDIEFRFATCAVESGAYEEAIPVLEKLDKDWWEDTPAELDYVIHYYLGKSYEATGKTEEAIKWYKRYLGNTPNKALHKTEAIDGIKKCEYDIYKNVNTSEIKESPLVYLGEDFYTRGDYIGFYGQYSTILCAMQGKFDVLGGKYPPVYYNPKKEKRPPRLKNIENSLIYTVEIDQEKDAVRYWRSLYTPGNTAGLVNPSGCNIGSSWDDHGEIRPRKNIGPDLKVSLSIPKGDFILSFYYCWGKRRHKVEIKDTKDNVLDERFIGDNNAGVYYRYLVKGPIDLNIKIFKGDSSNTTLSGVFLDEIKSPDIKDFGAYKDNTGIVEVIKSGKYYSGMVLEAKKLLLEINKNLRENKQYPEMLYFGWQLNKFLNDYSEEQHMLENYAVELQKTKDRAEVLEWLFPEKELILKKESTISEIRNVFIKSRACFTFCEIFIDPNVAIEKFQNIAKNNFDILKSKIKHTQFSYELLEEQLLEFSKKHTESDTRKFIVDSFHKFNQEEIKGFFAEKLEQISRSGNISADKMFYIAQKDKDLNKLDFNHVIDGYNSVIEKYPKSIFAEKAYIEKIDFASSIGNLDDAISNSNEFVKNYPKSRYIKKVQKKLQYLLTLVAKPDKIK